MAVSKDTAQHSAYPEGDAQIAQGERRQRRGRIWQALFMFSTMVGIVALFALLYNIINSSFGYVAVQNSVDPSALVLTVEEERMLSTPNLVSSEDDTELANGVAMGPYAIGFFGYAYYQKQAAALNALG
ncbi:MAG: hypothetical protein R2932_18215 [Caldilineaceae bacterium]